MTSSCWFCASGEPSTSHEIGIYLQRLEDRGRIRNGRTFALTDSFGEALANYAPRRTWNQPLVDISSEETA